VLPKGSPRLVVPPQYRQHTRAATLIPRVGDDCGRNALDFRKPPFAGACRFDENKTNPATACLVSIVV
jgi:hypothetical protein